MSVRASIELLRPGALQYKFRVDGEWRYDPLAPLARDEEGNLNNTLELLDLAPDYELPADFDAPPSPSERCAASLRRSITWLHPGVLRGPPVLLRLLVMG